MASWLRSLWKNPKNAVVPRGENEPALIAAEYYGIFDEAGRCVALPESTFDDRHCHACPVGSVPEASDFLRSIGATPRPSLSQPLRIVVISDTHEFHQHLVLPPGDILIHCGDVLTIDRFNIGAISNYNIKDFFAWFNAQPFPLRIVIGGNHDHQFAKLGKDTIKRLASPSIYLEDELLDVGGLRFFGTPRSTANSRGSGNVAFQKVPELELGLEVWPTALPVTALQLQVECDSDPTETSGARIAVAEVPRSSLSSPDTVHFFMTHGSSNCRRVRRAIASLAPSLHLCGHVHEMHGAWALGPTAQDCERLTPSNKTGPSAWHRSIVSINGASTRGKPMRERLHAPIVFDFALTDSTAATTAQLLNQLAPGRVRSRVL